MKKSLLWLVVLVVTVSMVATFSLNGCKKEAAPAEEEVTKEAAPAEEEVTEEAAPAEEEVAVKKFNVGLSNGLITHSWRTQMTADLVLEFGYYKGKGIVDKLSIQHAGYDVDVQISQIRNLINSDIDLLLINPNSLSALDPVIEEAVEKGILVFAFDQSVTRSLSEISLLKPT